MSQVAQTEFSSELTDEDVSVTPAARAKMAELMAQVDSDEVEAIRVFVSGGGCSGMTYGMTFADARSEYDTVLTGDGYALYIDAVALNFLRGVEIDYVERRMGASFVFNNVFAATSGRGTCGGCGSAGGGCG